MTDYQALAEQRIKDLTAKKASTRRAAAYYLGEAGVDEAITRLVSAYRTDPDAGVRKAAAYALGMFRAVEEALARGEEEKVVALLRRVSEGKLGGRSVGRKRLLLVVELLLLALFVGLVITYVRTEPRTPPRTEEAITARGDAAILVGELRAAYNVVRDDGRELQRQFEGVLAGGELDCAAFFNGTRGVMMAPADSAAFPDLGRAAALLNQIQAQVATAYGRYEAACNGDEALDPAAIGALMTPLNTALQGLPEIDLLLISALITPTPEPTATDTLTPTPSETPTPYMTPTDSPAVVSARRHARPMTVIIDNMLHLRGPSSLLIQYWEDAQLAGATFACREQPPEIPADYVVPPEDVQARPELAQAAELLNRGLGGLREGWSMFRNACVENRLAERADEGLQVALAAQQAFRAADAILAPMRTTGGG